MVKGTNFAGITGKQIGDGKKGEESTNAKLEPKEATAQGTTPSGTAVEQAGGKAETTEATETQVNPDSLPAGEAAREEGTVELKDTDSTPGILQELAGDSAVIEEASGAQQILEAVDRMTAPIRTSVDTLSNEVGVVGAIDQRIDADITVVVDERAQEQLAHPFGDPAALAEADSGGETYSCHPMVNFNLGRFEFRGGQIKVESKDVAEFEELVAGQPPQIRHSIKHIDVDAANQLAKKLLGRQTSGIDTTANSLDAPNARPFG